MSLHENGLTPTVKKEKILVGILVVPPFITETKMKGTDGKDKIIYGGFVYEMWTLIKELNGWNDYVKEVSVEVDYDKVVMDVYNQKYDMVVGNFWVFRDRVEKVLMSRTLFVTKIVVIFKPKKSRVNTILAIGLTYFIVPLVIIILLGIIFCSYSNRQFFWWKRRSKLNNEDKCSFVHIHYVGFFLFFSYGSSRVCHYRHYGRDV